MQKLAAILIIMITSGCTYTFNVPSPPDTSRFYEGNELLKKYERTAQDYSATKQQYKYYPRYDPSADNPGGSDSGYQPNQYRYPKYNPSEDNPYYPPQFYKLPEQRPRYYYRYPKFNPEADNPYYPPNYRQAPPPPPKEDRLFDKPMFTD